MVSENTFTPPDRLGNIIEFVKGSTHHHHPFVFHGIDVPSSQGLQELVEIYHGETSPGIEGEHAHIPIRDYTTKFQSQA